MTERERKKAGSWKNWSEEQIERLTELVGEIVLRPYMYVPLKLARR